MLGASDGGSLALATRLHRTPVVDLHDGRLLGVVALFDLLQARVRNLEAERRRERVLGVRPWRRLAAGATTTTSAPSLPPV